MNQIDYLLSQLNEVESRLQYSFRDRSLLSLAFIHRSYVNEDKAVLQHNERLEFLGDSILGLLMADYLYRHFPETAEGDLSALRARLVEASSCAGFLKQLEVAPYLLMGKGERTNSGRGRDSILADLFEAIIGAIYLDGGLEAARSFLLTHFSSAIQHLLEEPLENWKAFLQDYCQKNFQIIPVYEVIEAIGPDHDKVFKVVVKLNDREWGIGTGPSKKQAQQAAARAALYAIEKKS